MIHELAQALSISDTLANTLVATFGVFMTALFALIGIVIKNGRDVRTIRNRVTSDVEDRRHAQNTRRFTKLERGQAEQKKAIVRIEDALEIEHTIVPPKKRSINK